MENWYKVLTPFYAIRGAILRFMYGIVLVYVSRLNPVLNWKLPVLLISGMIVVWLFGKLLFSVFELIISIPYQRDPRNYCGAGFVINKTKKKIENVNHLISISERYKNPIYRDELENFIPLFYLMFLAGLFVGFCIPLPSINM